MIVTIHPRVANRYPELDSEFPIQAFPAVGLPAYLIRGNQLMAAGVHTVRSTGEIVKPLRLYYMCIKDVVKVKYIKLTSHAQFLLGYRVPGKMRVMPFAPDPDDDELYHRVCANDAWAAGVPSWDVELNTQHDGMIYIKKSMTTVIREG